MKKGYTKRHPKKRGFPVWKIVLIIVTVLLFASIAIGATFLKVYRPSVDTDVPFDTDGLFAIETVKPSDSGAVPDDTPKDTEPSVPVSSETKEEVKFVRDTESVNFLVMGRDKDSWNTDVMMIVNFNMREGSLSIMQIPRDTYIRTDIHHGRLNSALAGIRNDIRAENRKISSTELLERGMSEVVMLLEKTLCIQIDGYAHVDLNGFKQIINIIGGVYMAVPYAMDYEDPEQNLKIHLEPGWQLLDGAKAEMFVRFRSGYVQADIGRIDAQKIFMTALFKQLKSNLSVSKVPALAEQILKYVTTDVPLADIIIYAKELLGVDMGKISMMTLHGTAQQTNSGAWYYIMNRAWALDAINSYFNVYNMDITDTMFDPTRAFNDDSYAPFSKIYYAAAGDATVQVKPDVETGEHISQGGLNIPLN